MKNYIIKSMKQMLVAVLAVGIVFVSMQSNVLAASGTSTNMPVRILTEKNGDYAKQGTTPFVAAETVTYGDFDTVGSTYGLSIDYAYGDEIPLKTGYTLGGLVMISIPLTGFVGDSLAGDVTIPVPDGYDAATAILLDNEGVNLTMVSHTSSTATFTVNIEYNALYESASCLDYAIEFKTAAVALTATDSSTNGTVSFDTATPVAGTDFTATATANTGYSLPDTITVKVGGTILAATDYTYNSSTGAITIPGEKVTGNIEIAAVCVKSTTTTTTPTTTSTTSTSGTDTSSTTSTATTSPSTGEHMNLIFLAVLFSALAVSGVVLSQRKKKVKK